MAARTTSDPTRPVQPVTMIFMFIVLLYVQIKWAVECLNVASGWKVKRRVVTNAGVWSFQGFDSRRKVRWIAFNSHKVDNIHIFHDLQHCITSSTPTSILRDSSLGTPVTMSMYQQESTFIVSNCTVHRWESGIQRLSGVSIIFSPWKIVNPQISKSEYDYLDIF
jgi:hypothetical protein